jgi:hypothetical protein
MEEPSWPTILQAALLLTKGEPAPDWLIEKLDIYARLIRLPKRKPGEDDVTLPLAAITILEDELYQFALAEEWFRLEEDDRTANASSVLYELREFFEELHVKRGKGGPVPDNRRRLCAGVYAEAWERLHGEVQPYSPKLQEACEVYWQACGHPETSTDGEELRSWERLLRLFVSTPN